MYEDPKSKISQLEKVLDARDDLVSKKIKRHELHDHHANVAGDWDQKEFIVGDEVTPLSKNTGNSLITEGSRKSAWPLKILIGSIIFFVLALLVVAYNFLSGGNVVSGNNIEITVKSPISIAGGEILSFELEIKNNNNVTLVGADLGLDFPSSARNTQDSSEPAKRVQQFLGDILPGQTVKKNFSVILFGLENEKEDIKISLEYKISGSNSLFNKTKNFTTLISSAPVNIVISGPREVNTNQVVDYTVDITSNSTAVIKNLLLKVDYPFGFSYVSSNPATFSKNNLWLIGDLGPGVKRTIKFVGVLSGQEGEERSFNFEVGSQSTTDNLNIDVPFASNGAPITIRRPFVGADIYLNGSTNSEYIASAGSEVETVIKWRNNLAYEVSDVSLVVKINGNMVDKSSIRVDGGFYRSIDNTIVFNKATDKTLARLDPGQEGESIFTFRSFGTNSITGAGLINPTIVLDLAVSGQRLQYGEDQENVLFSDSRKVKITSNPQLSAKALYYIGPFQNTGPVPPKSEQETTYTITWTVINPLNNLSGARVTTVLPPYITWLSAVSPQGEKVDYDAGTGTVVWNIGNISSGAGVVSSAKQVSFQISLLPSVSQIGTAPDLVGDAVLTAKDNFTLTDVSNTFFKLNTRLSNDPYFSPNTETVMQ